MGAAQASTAALRGAETLALHAIRPDRRSVRSVARGLSRAAGQGRMWMALSATMAVRPTLRRAARDGLAAWGLAEALSFGAKSVAGRRRPSLVRAIGAPTRSSSMPSSHTAAAVAYATAAALRVPATGVVVVPLAVGVAWARTATGRHFPTDVAVGSLLGLCAGGAVHAAASRVDRRREGPASPDR